MAKWSVPFDKLAKKRQQDIETVIRESATYIFSRVIMMSPVDTGRFRANWNCSIGQINEATSDSLDPSGTLTLSSMQSTVLGMKMGQTIYLANALPYAVRLEYGWSKQAPQGMVRIVAREFANAVQRAVRNRR